MTSASDAAQRRRLRRRIQMIFQDPFASLDPRWRVGDIVAEPMLRLRHRVRPRATPGRASASCCGSSGSTPPTPERFPHEFSGGQRQRIAIARALAAESDFIVCDEPTSALDVSVQAQILNLMRDLQDRLGLTFLFISHNLAVVRHMATRIGVMYCGRLVEVAPPRRCLPRPRHPYTRMLLDAVPDLAMSGRPRTPVQGEPPNPIAPPPGCAFHPRCGLAKRKRCRREAPEILHGVRGPRGGRRARRKRTLQARLRRLNQGAGNSAWALLGTIWDRGRVVRYWPWSTAITDGRERQSDEPPGLCGCLAHDRQREGHHECHERARSCACMQLARPPDRQRQDQRQRERAEKAKIVPDLEKHSARRLRWNETCELGPHRSIEPVPRDEPARIVRHDLCRRSDRLDPRMARTKHEFGTGSHKEGQDWSRKDQCGHGQHGGKPADSRTYGRDSKNAGSQDQGKQGRPCIAQQQAGRDDRDQKET